MFENLYKSVELYVKLKEKARQYVFNTVENLLKYQQVSLQQLKTDAVDKKHILFYYFNDISRDKQPASCYVFIVFV